MIIYAIDTKSLVASLTSGSNLVVMIVLLILVLASLMSWTMIFLKIFSLKVTTRAANRFEEKFWSGANLNQMYNDMTRKNVATTGMASLFVDGFREYRRLDKQEGVKPQEMLDGVQRAMRVAMSREMDHLETNLSFLATVGSTSPYIGLFGTVWGIMGAIAQLSGTGQYGIGDVAGPISEALIATAMGLFAAIPAVIAYNRYSNKVERLLNRYEIFSEEFVSIVQRQTLKTKR
jgi:biopolymer transport protein TolQ